MSLFRPRRPAPPPPTRRPRPGALPLTPLDTAKWYDVYCTVAGEERVYEEVRFVGRRTLDPVTQYSSGLSGFLEIEASDGTRALVPQFGVHLVCECGPQPAYRVLRPRGRAD